MKKNITILLIILNFIIVASAQDYKFINEVISPYDENNPIPLDSIYLNKKFIILGENYIKSDYLNEQTIRFWWSSSDKNAPVELFLANFNINHLRENINRSQKDSIINFKKLNSYFYSCDDVFIAENQKNKYLSISKPFFNCEKNWGFIVKSEYTPYSNSGGNAVMYIYIKVDSKWILYNTLTLSLT